MDFGVRKFRELLLVATCGMAAEFLLALADTVIAGHLVGETALAGINLLQPVFNLVQFTAALIGTGTAIRFSLETGRLETRRAQEMFSQGLWSIIGFGAALCLCFVTGRDLFLGSFGAAPEALAAARAYWNWYAPCTVLLPVTLYMMAVVYADGDMVSCALGYGSLIGGNVIASFFLCREFGIAGCAMGTVIGDSAAALALFAHFCRRSNTLRILPHFRWRDLLLICKSAFADASVSLCWSLLFFLLAKLTVALFGSSLLPVLSIVLVLVNLTLLFNGVSAAAQPVVGIYAGERNARSVRAVMRAAVKTAFWEGVAGLVFFVAFPETAVRLVGLTDPAHVDEACRAVRIVSLGFLGAPFVFLFNSYYLFVERYALACALTFVADIVVYAVLCPPFAWLWGPVGLWVALGISPIVAVFAFAVFVFVRYGCGRFPLLLSPVRERHQQSLGIDYTPAGMTAASAFVERALESENRGGFAAEARRIVVSVMERVIAVNGGATVHGEVALDCNDGVRLVLRDDGKIDDAASAVSAGGRHVVTMGYNRNLFEL